MAEKLFRITFSTVCSVLACTGISHGDPLPFKDGKYVTDQKLCSMTEDEAIREYGDQIGFMTRNIKGSELSNSYEMFCTIKAADKEGDNVIFSAQCDSEGETEEIVGSYAYISDTSFRFRGNIYERCQLVELEQTNMVPFFKECPWSKGIWQTQANFNDSEDTVHQFRFAENVGTSGSVIFSEFRNGKLAWSANGTFGCSNGVSICGVTLKGQLDAEIETEFEDVQATNKEKYRVFSILRQISHSRGGLSVTWHNGFSLTADEQASPSNVYMLTGCK